MVSDDRGIYLRRADCCGHGYCLSCWASKAANSIIVFMFAMTNVAEIASGLGSVNSCSRILDDLERDINKHIHIFSAVHPSLF